MERSDFRRVPKQARSQERFDKILETAANLFSEKGFDGTTTNEIAREAGISIGSLYQYFDDKNAIVGALTDRYVQSLREVTDTVMETDVANLPTDAAVGRLMAPIFDFHSNHPGFRALWLGTEVSRELRSSMEAMDEEVRGRVEELFEVRAPGIPREKARIAVIVMHLALQALLGFAGRSDDPRLIKEAADEMRKMFVGYVDGVIREHKA